MISTVTSQVTEPPMAPQAGADLREARERLGLSLAEVASDLRIRLPHLQAREDGRISLLPGNAYALAFVRTYAAALGLDPEEMVRRFKAETAAFGRPTDLVFPVPMPERGLPPGAVVLLGLVLAVGAYAGWYRLSGEGRLPAETVTPIPEHLASLAEQALPPPGLTAAAPATPDPAASQAEASTPHMPPDPAPPVMAISPTSAAAAQLPSRSSDGSAGAGPGGLSPADPPDGGRIVLHASADAWLLVKDRTGIVLLNRTMKPGETWPVPPRPDLLLTTGNAGGTDILVDGGATPSVGASGTVRRDILLDPDQIKDGRLAGAGTPQFAAGRPRQ